MASRRQIYRERWLKQGCCASCGAVREDENLTTCRACRAKAAERNAASRRKRLCIKCKIRPIARTRGVRRPATCLVCRAKLAAYMRERVAKAKAKGLCRDCTKHPIRPGVEGATLCVACHAKRLRPPRKETP